MFNNVIISDNCLSFFILYHYFLSSSTINCVNLRSDPEFKLIFTDAVLDFESITQHPDNKTQHIQNFATLLKMKRDKWFLNSPSKWNMLEGLKNIYDWYLILAFPTAIFFKVHAHYRHELVFFLRYSRPRRGVHYATLMMVGQIKKCNTHSKHGHQYSRNIKSLNIICCIVVFSVFNFFLKNFVLSSLCGMQGALRWCEFDIHSNVKTTSDAT